MEKPKICVVGACNLDLISYVPRLPRMGETLHGNRFHMGFGGKGANQAIMAAKMGGDVTMVTKLGQDVFGENTLKTPNTFILRIRRFQESLQLPLIRRVTIQSSLSPVPMIF
jgi:ribokinase